MHRLRRSLVVPVNRWHPTARRCLMKGSQGPGSREEWKLTVWKRTMGQRWLLVVERARRHRTWRPGAMSDLVANK